MASVTAERSPSARKATRTARSEPSAEAMRHARSLVGAALAQTVGAEPEAVVKSVVAAMDGRAVEGLLARADKDRPTYARLGAAPWSKALSKLDLEATAKIPVAAVRPGQTQLSHDHVAAKMLGLVEDILDGKAEKLTDLFDLDDFPVVVAPGGSFAVLRDGHHKLGSLLALSALVHETLGTKSGASSRTALNVGGAFETLAKVIPPPDEIQLPIYVEGQEAKLSNGEKDGRRLDDFFAKFDDALSYDPPLYLARRDGTTAAEPPRKMSALVDNPYRRLAAELVAKLKWDDDGMPVLKKVPNPLWLKGPDAPPYVEFHVADVIENAAKAIGFEYRPGAPIPEPVRDAFRKALLDAQDDAHPVLQQVISFEHDIDVAALRTSMQLIRHAVLDFGKGAKKLDDDEIPVVLLASDAPDVHRLHAAARLHGALTEAGADFHAESIDGDIARATIARLDRVHDEVGLWINHDGLTVGALKRDAKLARGLAMTVERKGKSKLKADGGAERPLWVDVPGLPKDAGIAVGAALSDLLEKVEHDPQRLGEIRKEARGRLIDAKTHPAHPLYEQLASVPVVVSGSADAVAASLRVGRKKHELEVGHQIEGFPVPHVLPPRTRVVVDL